jgi:tetrathionate reductase subunit B
MTKSSHEGPDSGPDKPSESLPAVASAFASKRNFLKTGLITLAAAACLPADGNSLASTPPRCYGMIIDLNRCTGCQACVIACKGRNDTAPTQFNTRILIGEGGQGMQAGASFRPVQCNQCENPPCVPVCPTKATFKLANGVVVTDWDLCNGSGNCVVACPYSARFLDPRHGNRVDKCDFCLDRVERGLAPSCVESCSPNARLFGDLNAPQGEFAIYLKKAGLQPHHPEFNLKTSISYVPVRHGRKGSTK